MNDILMFQTLTLTHRPKLWTVNEGLGLGLSVRTQISVGAEDLGDARINVYSRGQRQLLDVVDPDQLSDAEATEMLQRFDAAEPGDRVQELDRGRRQT